MAISGATVNWPRHFSSGPFFPGKIAKPQKSRSRVTMLATVGLELSPLFERKGGQGSASRTSPAGSTTRRLPSKNTARMGDKAKPSVSHMAGGFAVSELLYSAAAFKTSAPSLRK
jgi:hypothetical protein